MNRLTQAMRKQIRGLQRKKERYAQGLFLVEGRKAVGDLLASAWRTAFLVSTEAWEMPGGLACPHYRVSEAELAGLSALDTPQQVLAVVEMPPLVPFQPQGRWLGLDGLQDPGNLGTLIRLADWFGFTGLLCSPDCVDRYNPKTVQASMGSLFRVPVAVADLAETLAQLPQSFWAAGTFLEGTSLYATPFPAEGLLVFGHEGQGIRPETANRLEHRLTLPGRGGAESLNVAMAASIFCAEWMRNV